MPTYALSEIIAIPNNSGVSEGSILLSEVVAIPGQTNLPEIGLSEILQVSLILEEKVITAPEFFPSLVPGWGDIKFDGEDVDIISETGIDTTLFLALFTDTRAEDSDPLPNSNNDKRGWWGDEILGIKTGSRIWLRTERGKLTSRTVELTKQEMEEAIQRQLIDPGIITSVDISYETFVNGVKWKLTLYRTYDNDISLTYNQLWDGQITKEALS